MKGSKAGSAKAEFEKIYYDTYDYIYKYLLLKIGSKDTVEDIIQTVYLRFYRRLCDIEENGGARILDPKHYLLRSAKGLTAEYYQKRAGDNTEPIEDNIEIVDERALEMLENDYSFTYEEIMQGLRSSDEVTYKIFMLHFHYGLTLEQAARKLSLSESTVKSKLYRALKKLKKNITEKEGGIYEAFTRH